MDHKDLKDIAQCSLGFVPNWTYPTINKILAICEKHQVDPSVYLRAFTNNTTSNASVWHVGNIILSEKWQEFIPAALQEMETEAKVAYEHDALVFVSTLAIEGDPAAVIDSRGVDMCAVGRVVYARRYKLKAVEDKWMKSALKEARANPCLAEIYSFWQQ